MEFLKRSLIITTLSILFLNACAEQIQPVVNAPESVVAEQNIGQNFLQGQFTLEDGSVRSLADLNDKPLVLYFVGEFCGSCRQEAIHLKEMISVKGLPTKIHLASVMLEVNAGTATEWFDSISPASPKWILGSDASLGLYFQYFQQLVTPSIIFFDPNTQILKRWQKVIPLNQLEQETVPWY